MKEMKIVAPWTNFYREIQALFGSDPDVEIEYDETTPSVTLKVDGTDKAEAIAELLPMEKTFGNVTLYIYVVPANKEKTRIGLFMDAFAGNPAFSYAASVEGVSSNAFHYVVFKNKVVQYYNDDLSDINGLCSTLYQEIAKDVFDEEKGVYFCTDTEKNLGIPVER